MKKFYIIIFLFLPSILRAKFYSEIWSGFQLNYPTASSVAPAIGRLRLGKIFITPNPYFNFHIRTAIAYGKSYFGSTSLMTPANDIAVDSKSFTIDEAYFLFSKKRIKIFTGLIHYNDAEIFSMRFAGNENNGFFSTHFLKLLANNGTDQFIYQSIPAFFFIFSISKNIVFKTGISSGLASVHLFLRNTVPVEISINTHSFYLSINAGFADADSSEVHKISPSWGIIIEKRLFYNFFVFFKFSRVEKDIKTFRTPDIEINDDYKVAKEFSPFKQHFAIGFTKQEENFGTGIGYSRLKNFEKKLSEQIIEIFIRTKIFDMFETSPDFQYIFNPNGDENCKYMWIAGLRFFYKFDSR